MNSLSIKENIFLDKIKSILSSIVEYDHIQTMLKYVDYINDNDMYSEQYRQTCINLIRDKTMELRKFDLEDHISKMKEITDRFGPVRTIDNEPLI